MAEKDLRRVFPGTASIAETTRACEEAQRRKRMQVEKISPAIAEISGADVNANIVEFKNMKNDEDKIFKNLLFVDISTPTGASDAAAAPGKGFTPMFECKMFVADSERSVKVFGKLS